MTDPNNSIARRMGRGFVVLFVLLAVLLGWAYRAQQKSEQAAAAYTQRIGPLTQAVPSLGTDILRVAVGVRAYLLTRSDAALRAHAANVEEVRTELARFAALPRDPDGEVLFQRVAARVEYYLDQADDLAALGRTGPGASEAAELQLAKLREETLSELDRFGVLQAAKAKTAVEVMQQSREQAMHVLLAAAALSLLFVAVLGWGIVQSVRKPARQLVRVADAMRQGDWKSALAWLPGPEPAPPARELGNEMIAIAQAFGASAREIEKRERSLLAQAQVSAASGSSLVREELAGRALGAVAAHVKAEAGAVYWSAKPEDRLHAIASQGLAAGAQPLSRTEGIPGDALAGRPVIVRDLPPDGRFQWKLGLDQAPPRAIAALPIGFLGEVRGVLLLASLRDFDDAAIKFMEFATTALAVGLANAAAYEHEQRLLSDLGASHERIQRQNEELQAQNEELQAQSEELQAQSEELHAQSEEIQGQNEQLNEQTEQLRGQAEALREADERKNQFMGLLAHELRNPIAGIANSLHLLALSGATSEHAATAQAVIERQTRQLSRLIDDLLDVTRITRGKIELQRENVDFVQVIQDCVADHRPAFARKQVEIDLDVPDGPLWVEGDRVRLCQVVCNLLDNAAKFSDPGKRVGVSLHGDSEVVRLTVADRGVGIDPKFMQRLFEPFSQGDPGAGRMNTGLGLGLALVKSLVDMHGGTVEAHSDGPGTGARFVIAVPHAAPQESMQAADPDAPAVGSAPAAGGQCRVLIIDDHADVAESLHALLVLLGHEVRLASTGMEGLEIARQFHPDVLLCDIGLPVIDGYEVARRFRADVKLGSVLLVAITGYATANDGSLAGEAGFDHHFPKPPDIKRLSGLLAQVAISKAKGSSSRAGMS